MITHTLADQVYERLENEILTGKYKRGEVLTEQMLCENLGVSRTPVREAMRRLEQDHIIESGPRGMIVIGISAHDVEIIYDIREHVEGLAAAACAQCITDEQLAELQETVDLQEFYAAKRDAEKVKAMDSAFHEKIYQYSGSAVYYDTLVPLHRKVQKVRKRSMEDRSRATASTAEHRRIFEAIAAHDGPAAAEAMQQHVRMARAHLQQINAFHETQED